MSSIETSATLLAHAGVSGVLAVGTLIFAGMGLVHLRCRKDRARRGFLWLRLALFTSFLTFVFNVAQDVVGNEYLNMFTDSGYNDQNLLLSDLGATSAFFLRLTNVLLIATLSEVGNGFSFALDRQRTLWQKAVRAICLVVGVALFAMAIAGAALATLRYREYLRAYDDYYGSSWGWSGPGDDDSARLDAAIDGIDSTNDLILASSAVELAIFVFLLVQASMVRHRYRGVAPSENSATLYLVAAVLSIPRLIWAVVFIVIQVYGYSLVTDVSFEYVSLPIDIVLNQCITFITLVLLFFVGFRKHNGLWTTTQPWMNGVAPVMTQAHPKAFYAGGQPAMYQQGGAVYPPPNTVAYQPAYQVYQSPPAGYPVAAQGGGPAGQAA